MCGCVARTVGALVVLALTSAALAAEPPDVTREWAAAVPPPAPELTAVAVDPKTTALLVMDFNKGNCTPERRVRCWAAIPSAKKVLDAARAKGIFVVQVITPAMQVSDVVDALSPIQGEPVLQVQGDKFFNSDLERMLKQRGVTTVIAMGSSGNGAVLLTALGGAARGFDIVVPVDTMPADSAYHEQFTLVEMKSIGFLNARTKLTRSDMISVN